MDTHKFKKQLGRYLKGKTNETENAVIEAWYKSYQDAEQTQLSDQERGRIKNAVYGKINSEVKKPAGPVGHFYRIAASIVLISGISLFTWYVIYKTSNKPETYTTLQTRAGEVKQITLPDSSVIYINAASRLRIPASFNERELREVYLDEGEAFFKVKRNINKPFRVHTTTLRVQVLGTSFNINTYSLLPFEKVTVATGKVSVSNGNRQLSVLTPGQELTFITKSGAFSQKNVNIANCQSWKDGDTYLTDVGFQELSLVFKNHFGVLLRAGTSEVDAYHFTLRIKRNLPLDETLKVISEMHNTHFRKEGNQVILY